MIKGIIKKSFLYYAYERLRKKKQSFYVRHFPMAFIRNKYKKLFGVFPNLDKPVTFSEKIQWLKLNYRNSLMVQCADKVLVREYVKGKIGNRFLNDLLYVYNNVDEVEFSILPDQFVFKPNNSSGRVIICKDKSKFNQKKAVKIMKKWENENLFFYTGEWIYKDIPYRLICEKFLADNITDYKMYFVYDKFIATQVISDRQNGFYVDYFDEN
ncbi:MAG TPA: glycosyl transferase, partial [Gallicola sp.]|nr:glycosyl transferase [Gallicola sp.]